MEKIAGLWFSTFVLSLVSSKSCEGNRVPLRATISLESGPGWEGLEVRDSALSCSSRDKTIPSPLSSEESRVCRRRPRSAGQQACPAQFVCTVRGHLFEEGQVAAALSEAQQQRQDVDGAGGWLGRLGAGRRRGSLGQTKLLSHCRRGKHMCNTY